MPSLILQKQTVFFNRHMERHMGIEIERKFMVKDPSWQPPNRVGIAMRQGYLKNDRDAVVRVRIAGEAGFLTIKSKTVGASRLEFEYPIPFEDAEELLLLCQKPLVEKVRYLIDVNGIEWSIDVFSGSNEGLIVAEVELEHENQVVKIPPWAGDEVTGDSRFYNSNLITHPFTMWNNKK